MTTAQRFLNSNVTVVGATSVEFFTRSTIFTFADGSVLVVNMYSPSYAY